MFNNLSKCESVPKTPAHRYNKCVSVGNWLEERASEEELIKDYLHKRDNNLLSWQKIDKINKEFLELVDLSYSEGGYVKYGNKVMLVNTPAFNSNSKVKTLCIHVPHEIIHSHSIDPSFINTAIRDVTASNFLYSPTKISTFVIRGTSAAKDNQVLRYGESFYLFNNDEKLLMTSVKQTPFKSAGNLSGNNAVAMIDQCNYSCHFQILPFNRNFTLELEGEPVPANSRVIINHKASNENLCLEEDVTLDSVFGPMKEVSCKTLLNHHRTTCHQNHWCIFLDSIRKDNFPITLKPFV